MRRNKFSIYPTINIMVPSGGNNNAVLSEIDIIIF